MIIVVRDDILHRVVAQLIRLAVYMAAAYAAAGDRQIYAASDDGAVIRNHHIAKREKSFGTNRSALVVAAPRGIGVSIKPVITTLGRFVPFKASVTLNRRIPLPSLCVLGVSSSTLIVRV